MRHAKSDDTSQPSPGASFVEHPSVRTFRVGEAFGFHLPNPRIQILRMGAPRPSPTGPFFLQVRPRHPGGCINRALRCLRMVFCSSTLAHCRWTFRLEGPNKGIRAGSLATYVTVWCSKSLIMQLEF